MVNIVIKIYDWLRHHRMVLWGSLVALTLLLAGLITRVNYKEDISDFLPLEGEQQNALEVYKDISGANRLFAIFRYTTGQSAPDSLVGAVDEFVELVEQADTAGYVTHMMAEIDLEDIAEMTGYVYSNIPYFITDEDFDRLTTALADTAAYADKLAKAKELLMFPTGGLLSENISRDPLNAFTPIVARLQGGGSSAMNYEMYEGHILSPDRSRAIVMMESPFGSSETASNKLLLDLLNQAKDDVESSHPGLEIHITGGPAIAVDNADRIKSDSILAVALAVVLILALLFYVFRANSNLLLIFFSIGWGAAFALGLMALISDNVSIIVLGISAVILGIAVNYPLHFIAHLSHTPSVKDVLKEIVAPLVVGNVTTVGAFLALVPLNSTALRDLGLFSSLLLIGTIFFVIIYLPHMVRLPKAGKAHPTPALIARVGEFKIEEKRWIVVVVCAITVVLGYFSLHTEFDTNMSNINYLTPQQRADMEYFQSTMVKAGGDPTLYVVTSDTTLDAALSRGAAYTRRAILPLADSSTVSKVSTYARFIPSREDQTLRLQQWRGFIAGHRQSIKRNFERAAKAEGFNPEAFEDFFSIIDGDYEPREIDFFEPLTRSMFAQNISVDSVSGRYSVVNILSVPAENVEAVKTLLKADLDENSYCFDVKEMNSSMANRLSDDFNYIGWACALIVFFFLWFSLGNLELALLSFLPMAISWVWILGLMALLGIKFNIVNIILATFIFGQGDDYTIFMTEGAIYEYAYRRKMLASYKNAIIISAVIMFIGIGTLIFAKHPAMKSLAEVTIVGMFSVVLMAYLFPPLIFNWLVKSRGRYRLRPLSIMGLFSGSRDKGMPGDTLKDRRRFVSDRYRYRGMDVERATRRELKRLTPQALASYMPENSEAPIIYEGEGYGATAMMLALTYPDREVTARLSDADHALIGTYAAEPLPNLTITH